VEQLADGVFRLRGFPPDAINIYVVDDVLLDAGTVFSRRRILGETAGWGIAAHALTHAHPDHFGSPEPEPDISSRRSSRVGMADDRHLRRGIQLDRVLNLADEPLALRGQFVGIELEI